DSARGGGGEPARADAPARRAPVTRRQRSDRRAGLFFLAPPPPGLGCVTPYPPGGGVLRPPPYPGPTLALPRLARLAPDPLLATDPRYMNALRVTLIFAAVSVALELALGLGAALLLRHQRAARQAVLSLLLLPWALPSVVTAKLFEWLYHPTAGLVNFLLGG